MNNGVPSEFTFAGSSYGEPWWVIGDITRRLLEPHGFTVSVATESAANAEPALGRIGSGAPRRLRAQQPGLGSGG